MTRPTVGQVSLSGKRFAAKFGVILGVSRAVGLGNAELATMRILVRILVAAMNVVGRIDVGLWYLLDFRRKSLWSWAPCILMAVPLSMIAGACLTAHNGIGAAICGTLAVALILAKAAATSPD
jgi:hypothetical protein